MDGATKRYIKIYGERNSGTTYLQMLVEQNLNVDVLPGVAPRRWRRFFRGNETMIDLYFRLTFCKNLGWKHQAVTHLADSCKQRALIDRTLFLIIAKNPYAWLLSLFRHPYHYRGELTTFEAFLRGVWQTVGRERHSEPFATPIAMWNVKHAAYLDLADKKTCVIIRYEDLLADPKAIITRISETYALPRRNAQFLNVFESAKGEGTKDFDYYRTYYLEELWRNELSADHIALISSLLDRATVKKFGYNLLG